MTSRVKSPIRVRWRLGLHGQMMLALFVMVSIVGGIGGYALIAHEEKVHLAAVQGETSHVSGILSLAVAPALWNVDKSSIDALLNSLAAKPEVLELTVTAANTGIVSSVKPRPAGLPTDQVVQVTAIYHVRQGSGQSERLGELRVVMSKDPARAQVRRAHKTLFVILFCVLAGLYFATFHLLQWLVLRPIARLSLDVDRIASGDLNVNCPVGANDELAVFATRVNAMASNLRATMGLLRASEEKYRCIFENASEGIFLLNRRGRFLDVNPAMVRLFDYPSAGRLKEASVGGDAPAHLFSAAQVSELFAKAATNQGIVGLEMPLRKLHGERIWVELNARAVRNASGTVELLEGMIADVTVQRHARIRLLRNRESLAREVAERRRAEADLLDSKHQLQQLAAHMESIREDERKQIAMTIHDELGQLLTALKINLVLFGRRIPASEQHAVKIAEMTGLVDRTLRIVRDVASNLRPAALNYGLASALEWLASEFSRHGMPCRFLLAGEEPRLDDARATAVFRVAQEALTNVARHANATRAELRIVDLGAAYELTVEDDGQGFETDIKHRRNSYGLLGMQERARALGATIEIDSAVGNGTTVRVVLPKTLNISQQSHQTW
ncbi:PAS domain S-box protein [Burkholderia pyrrocinia]|uniref:PAS domain S-box protein n=1 Tax=Burkholderia pyrrocinia TaxID=60550 RepID=UPI00215B1E36|nr:PAS domain S-box protein [Burkholderia pyrrocinia]UVE67861.1 PAS domain S-box protein [Burkholderia pyrrocinia]